MLGPGRHRAVRHPEPPHARPPRRDHRPVPLPRVRPRRARGALRRALRAGPGPRAVRLAALHGDRQRGAGQARPPARQGPAPPAPARAGPHEAVALRRRAAAATATSPTRAPRPSRSTTSSCATRACSRRSTSARSASGRRVTSTEPRPGGRLHLVRRRLRRPATHLAPPHALRGLRRGDHRPAADRRGAGRGLRRLVPTRTPSAASTSPPTPSSAARAGCSRRRIDEITPAGPVLDVGRRRRHPHRRAARAAAARPPGSSGTPPATTSATSRSPR